MIFDSPADSAAIDQGDIIRDCPLVYFTSYDSSDPNGSEIESRPATHPDRTLARATRIVEVDRVVMNVRVQIDPAGEFDRIFADESLRRRTEVPGSVEVQVGSRRIIFAPGKLRRVGRGGTARLRATEGFIRVLRQRPARDIRQG